MEENENRMKAEQPTTSVSFPKLVTVVSKVEKHIQTRGYLRSAQSAADNKHKATITYIASTEIKVCENMTEHSAGNTIIKSNSLV
jgi:hypothetical protein